MRAGFVCAIVGVSAVLLAGFGAVMTATANPPAPAMEQPAPAVGQTTDAMAYIQACQEEVTNLTHSELGQRAQNMTNQTLLIAAYKRIKELEDAAKAAEPAPAEAPKAKTTK